MKVSLNWLKDYVNISISPPELYNRLALAGIEAKEVKIIGADWNNVIIGQVTAINPHPNADRLVLATVNLGDSEETVVTGAPNLKTGYKVPFAKVGARLIDGHTGQPAVLKPARIRGVASSGMVCSEKELGISENHEGIMVLPDDAPIGKPLKEYLGDAIFDFEVTPNRPDCLSITGIARETSALTGEKLNISEIAYPETGGPIQDRISVEIHAPELCPRYCASLITGVKIGESPRWMKQRLLACGMRPINNIVDITNYVMLEYGQPLHSFDYERIKEKKIIVRQAYEDEKIVSLDGVERNLKPEMLVIADTKSAVAIAGVMGGANSEVTEGTTSILLEAANFKATSIHYTARSLGLPSEASYRFERGIRAELAPVGLRRATQLMLELAGGVAARGIVDVYPGRKEIEPISISTTLIKRILGLDFSLEEAKSILVKLGFECRGVSHTEMSVKPPYWRSDIRLPVDLVEEVARISGYDKIPSTLLGEPIPHQTPDTMASLKTAIRQRITGFGYQEIVTYTLVGMESLVKLFPEKHTFHPNPVRLVNPMTAEMEYLRPTLRSNLLQTMALNRRFEEGGIRLFELGRIYLPRENNLPEEPEFVCGVLSGLRTDRFWQNDNGEMDFYDAKGVVEGLLATLGITAVYPESDDESLHPGKQANVVIDGKVVGIVGEVHPSVLKAFDITERACLFELNLHELLPFTIALRLYKPISRFPANTRDIAVVVDSNVKHSQIADLIKKFPMVTHLQLFDVYTGEQVPAGKKSFAYRLAFQSLEKTLTDREVDEVQQQIVDALGRALGATLRQ